MKILNFGSFNYDYVYQMDHFTLPKETQSSKSFSKDFGGKGFNQTIALAKAGLEVYQAGKVGSDGQELIDYLKKNNVNVDNVVKDDSIATGHAIIEVVNAENRIFLYGGSNQAITEKEIDETLSHFEKGDVMLLQNEINNMAYIIKKAHERGLYIVFNTAPMNDLVFTYPLDLIDLFVVNEVEGQALAKCESDKYEDIIERLKALYPGKEIIMTVGGNGSYYIKDDTLIHQDAYKVKAVDTTAAGDTFTGFYLASYLKDHDVKKALDLASRASSITVTREGAAFAIPSIDELI